ncbi:hypothetical protein DFJ69_1475 [Thermomonospora umbrina]|uniref:Uncharacterized protein n=1 Tax=Thermomonospora umbrina TaxID=111806 RepID=A0A3D9SQ12_9ACTN|nr:hypothetical protein DFJ69_1475 [Thermomonospora umbrina]
MRKGARHGGDVRLLRAVRGRGGGRARRRCRGVVGGRRGGGRGALRGGRRVGSPELGGLAGALDAGGQGAFAGAGGTGRRDLEAWGGRRGLGGLARTRRGARGRAGRGRRRGVGLVGDVARRGRTPGLGGTAPGVVGGLLSARRAVGGGSADRGPRRWRRQRLGGGKRGGRGEGHDRPVTPGGPARGVVRSGRAGGSGGPASGDRRLRRGGTRGPSRIAVRGTEGGPVGDPGLGLSRHCGGHPDRRAGGLPVRAQGGAFGGHGRGGQVGVAAPDAGRDDDLAGLADRGQPAPGPGLGQVAGLGEQQLGQPLALDHRTGAEPGEDAGGDDVDDVPGRLQRHPDHHEQQDPGNEHADEHADLNERQWHREPQVVQLVQPLLDAPYVRVRG